MEKEPKKILDVRKPGKTGEYNLVKEHHQTLYYFGALEITAKEAGVDLKNAKVLELGSGNALLLEHARKQGVDMIGVDINLRGEYKGGQVRAFIEHLPFPDASFNVVYSSHIFDEKIYNQDKSAMLREAHRVLKPGGLYICIEPRSYVYDQTLFTKINKHDLPAVFKKI